MNIRRELEQRLTRALADAGAPEGVPALIAPSARGKFGDYQANGVMAAAKRSGQNPRELAQKVIEAADLSGLAEKLEVAGPGFINITLDSAALAKRLTAMVDDPRLGTDELSKSDTVVVDYSHPNLAKEMHVGHLRSTIIGDAIVRTLEFLGHNVIRHNHVGDWGTQFGMLIAYMDRLKDAGADLHSALSDLEKFYRASKVLFDSDAEFATAARQYVVKLQSGDEHCLEVWRTFIRESLSHCQDVYNHLNVTLTKDDVKAESSYNDDLPHVVEDLRMKGMLTESQGAQCVFLDEFKGKDGELLPAIVQKSDGGYLYATTDLAAIRYRSRTLKADRILYVVDARQKLHLSQVFAIARAAGFVSPDCSLEHHSFGMMLDASGRPFKTRAGGTIPLLDLLAEARLRARFLLEERSPDMSDQQRLRIADVVGIGAVKYADLCQNRTSDYIFSWDKMLSLDGNTAPYMQYAYARIQSIFRKLGDDAPSAGQIVITEAPERILGVRLARFAETVETVAADCLPNVMCAYLFDLAGAFMSFYEACPVIKAPDEAVRTSRLMLCRLTARTIQKGLDLLGIKTVEQM